jgi:methionyl-tRNA formyltransferase
MAEYIVATTKPWNVAAFQERTLALPGTWHLVEHPEDLTLELVERLRPRYIFSPIGRGRFPGKSSRRPNASAFT